VASNHIDIALDRTRADTILARFVLAMLARHANKKDLLAWPGQATLARRAGVSVRSIRSALRKLEALGEITEIRSGQGRASTVYRVSILAADFEVIEDDGNRKHRSGLELAETGRRGPVCENGKPEAQRRQTGSRLPIEEIEVNTPSLSPSEKAGEDGTIAEKQNGSCSSVFLSNVPDLSNSAVDEILGDRARGQTTNAEWQRRADTETRYPDGTFALGNQITSKPKKGTLQ
jgi:hypothetical protein